MDEVQPEACLPPCPSFLSDEAKKEYRRLGKELLALRLISEIDKTALALYCQTYSQWVEAIGRLQQEGLMVTTPHGHQQPSAWWSISRQCMEQLLRLAVEFGMTPASRSRVVPIPGPAPENKLSQFLRSADILPIRSDS